MLAMARRLYLSYQDADKYLEMLFRLLAKINTGETLQYIITLINDIVDGDADHRLVSVLHFQSTQHIDPFVILFSYDNLFPLSYVVVFYLALKVIGT